MEILPLFKYVPNKIISDRNVKEYSFYATIYYFAKEYKEKKSRFMSELRFNIQSYHPSKSERLTLSRNNFKGTFRCFSGKSGDHWVSLIPSLKVSGYGNSEEESLEDLRYNLNVFCEDIFSLEGFKRQLELHRLGWSQNTFFKKKFSTAYVDKDGVLQNFDHPEQVKDSMLETA